ncbi:MAG TPA: MFS transporter [Aestuariivirga sp.]|nr:MFS transporter [Aestuariivirga sp.]
MSASAAMSRRYGNLVAAIATIASCDIAMGLTFQLLPLLMEARGVPAWVMGLNAAMSPLAILLAGPFLPAVIARFGSKTVVNTVIAVIIAALLSFKIFPGLAAWFVIRFIFGIAAGTLFTVSEAWILSFAETGNRGRVMALYASVLSVTFAVGPIVIPLTGIDGWMPWLIGMVCVGLSALPLSFVEVSEASFRDDKGGSFLRFVARAPLLLFAVGSATIFDGILLSFFAVFGLRSGLDLQTVSWVLAAGILGNVLLQYPMGMLADRWSRTGVIAATAAITVVLCLAMIWTINSWLIWPVVIVAGSTAFAVYTISLTILGDSFEGPDLIAGSAAFSAMWGVGGLVGPPIAGAAIDAFGVNAMPVTLALSYVVLLIGLAWSGGRLVRSAAHG